MWERIQKWVIVASICAVSAAIIGPIVRYQINVSASGRPIDAETPVDCPHCNGVADWIYGYEYRCPECRKTFTLRP